MKIRALKGPEKAPSSSSATNGGLHLLRKEYNFALELRRQRESEEDGEKAAQTLSAKPIEGDSSPGTVEKRPICLGKITHGCPTVSHLLSRNPAYRKRCYELIHAAQNCAKPYKQIPLGQAIYLDPVKEEILWGDEQLVQSALQVSKGHSFGADVVKTKSAPQVDGKVRSPHVGAKINDGSRSASLFRSSGSNRLKDVSHQIGKMMVKQLRMLLGTPYRRLNCYELVVEGLRKVGIRYGGEGGLQQHLIRKAEEENLPVNAYLTGDGLIEASAEPVFARTCDDMRQPGKAAEKLWAELRPLLESGLLVNFSTGHRGHTGVIARHKGEWTLINSGFMDNDIHSSVKRKGVGEENLREEIFNWLKLASARRKPLSIRLGRINEEKVMTYKRKTVSGTSPTNG